MLFLFRVLRFLAGEPRRCVAHCFSSPAVLGGSVKEFTDNQTALRPFIPLSCRNHVGAMW